MLLRGSVPAGHSQDAARQSGVRDTARVSAVSQQPCWRPVHRGRKVFQDTVQAPSTGFSCGSRRTGRPCGECPGLTLSCPQLQCSGLHLGASDLGTPGWPPGRRPCLWAQVCRSTAPPGTHSQAAVGSPLCSFCLHGGWGGSTQAAMQGALDTKLLPLGRAAALLAGKARGELLELSWLLPCQARRLLQRSLCSLKVIVCP